MHLRISCSKMLQNVTLTAVMLPYSTRCGVVFHRLMQMLLQSVYHLFGYSVQRKYVLCLTPHSLGGINEASSLLRS
jgi:hypothetical protein